jgi:uroporphyrinogen-III synthase
MQRGGLVLWVRLRSPDREKQVQEILRKYGAEAVRVHEIDIAKGLDEIPLSKFPVDPLLAEHRRLGDV